MKNEYCDKCGKMLIPAPAKFDGESTYVGFLDHKCAESQPETIEPDKGKWPTDEEIQKASLHLIPFVNLQMKGPYSKEWFSGFESAIQWLKSQLKPTPSPENQEEVSAFQPDKLQEEFDKVFSQPDGMQGEKEVRSGEDILRADYLRLIDAARTILDAREHEGGLSKVVWDELRDATYAPLRRIAETSIPN